LIEALRLSDEAILSEGGILSATVVPMKSPYEGGVGESLPSKIRGLLPAHSAPTPEKRSAAF